MDLIDARNAIQDMNERQLRDTLLHVVLKIRINTQPTWAVIEDLLDKAMAARKAA